MSKWALVLLSLSFFTNLSAWPPMFGPEHTFTNQEVFDSYPIDKMRLVTPTSERYLKLMSAELARTLEQDQIRDQVKMEGSYKWGFFPRVKVTFKDGYHFTLITDPGVIEVIAKPATLKEYEKHHEARIQKYVFDVAARVGLTPWEFAGAGHIHIDSKSAFGKDGFLYRQFDVDFRNHPILAAGGLNNDPTNSIALTELSGRVREAYRQVIAMYDAGQIVNTPAEVAKMIDYLVYSIHEGDPVWNAENPKARYRKHRYHDLNLQNMYRWNKKRRTIEIRCIRPQLTAHSYVKLQRLFQKRIEYLKTVKKPIPFLNRSVPVDPHQAIQQFYEYILPTGLEFKDYIEFIVPDLQAAAKTFKPNKVFERPKDIAVTPCLKLRSKGISHTQ